MHNRAGANMAGGIASTLLDAARSGGIDGDLGLFEVDEFWLPRLARDLRPRALLLANLFRDQLDRYGELETIAERWAEVVASLPDETRLVLNADDPLVADLGRGRANVTYFGVEDDAMALPQMQHAADSKHCRRCGHAYVYEAVYLGHLGRYRCPRCGTRRPDPDVVARDVRLNGTRGATFALRIGGAAPREVAAPPPRPLQRLQRARRGRALPRARASRTTTSSPAWRRWRRRSGARRRSRSTDARCRSC